jgi:hypothetical protein
VLQLSPQKKRFERALGVRRRGALPLQGHRLLASLAFSPVLRPSVSQTMSEPPPESKSVGMAEPDKDPWRAAFVEFKTRDEKMVKDYQEEIDTLLVFVRSSHRLFACCRSDEPTMDRPVSSPRS